MTMYILAAVAAAIAATLFFIGRSQAAKAREIAGTETTTVARLAELAAKVAAEIGAGSFSEPAELKGRALAETPLRAEFSGTDCVWYECVATREYEEDYWETDSKGERQRRTRRGSEQVSSIRRDPPFLLDDGTGTILVESEGATIEPEKSLSRFEPASSAGTLRLGSFSLDLGRLALSLAGGRRTLGYRLEERCIPVGRQLYALGRAVDSGGRLRLAKPAKGEGRFLISLRSEEEIVAGARTGSLWLRVSSAVAAAASLVLAVLGIVGG